MASTPKLHWNGDVNFIGWLDGVLACKARFNDLYRAFRDVVTDFDSVARPAAHLVAVVRRRVGRNSTRTHAFGAPALRSADSERRKRRRGASCRKQVRRARPSHLDGGPPVFRAVTDSSHIDGRFVRFNARPFNRSDHESDRFPLVKLRFRVPMAGLEPARAF